MTAHSAGANPYRLLNARTCRLTRPAYLGRKRPSVQDARRLVVAQHFERDWPSGLRLAQRPGGDASARFARSADRRSSSSSVTSASVTPAYRSSPTLGRLIITFAAAPLAAAPASRAATSRSLDALRLLRPAIASTATIKSPHTRGPRPSGCPRPGGQPPAWPLRGRFCSSSVSRGILRAAAKPRTRARRHPPAGAAARAPLHAICERSWRASSRIVGVLGSICAQPADHRQQARGHASGNRRRAAAAWHGLGRSQPIFKLSECQIGIARVGLHAADCRSVSGDRCRP